MFGVVLKHNILNVILKFVFGCLTDGGTQVKLRYLSLNIFYT